MIGPVTRRLAKAFKHFRDCKTYCLHWFGCDNSQVISAMDHSPLQTCVLKMDVKCENCQKKVKKTLQKIHGVHSIKIDANEGKVEVSSTVDPHLVIAMLARSGQNAELLWETAEPQAVNNLNQVEHQDKKLQFDRSNANGMDRDKKKSQLVQLEEIAKIPGLKQAELNESGNIKMIFNNGDELECCSVIDHHHHVAKINVDGVQWLQEQAREVASERATPTPPPPPPPPPPPAAAPPSLSLNCGGGGGGDGASSSSTSLHCCHNHPEVKFACSQGYFGIRYTEEPIRPPPYFALPPPHFVHPFAPPPNHHFHQGPPPPGASPPHYDMYHCEDNSACSMM